LRQAHLQETQQAQASAAFVVASDAGKHDLKRKRRHHIHPEPAAQIFLDDHARVVHELA
jgi:hypothetical protein